MITVLHRGGLANDYSIPWILGCYIRNIISKDLTKKHIFSVSNKSGEAGVWPCMASPEIIQSWASIHRAMISLWRIICIWTLSDHSPHFVLCYCFNKWDSRNKAMSLFCNQQILRLEWCDSGGWSKRCWCFYSGWRYWLMLDVGVSFGVDVEI